MAKPPNKAGWRHSLERLDAERTALVDYAAQFTTDRAEAERAVDQALVAVVARGGSARAADTAAAVRRKVRGDFGSVRRRVAARPADPDVTPAARQDPAERMAALAARVRRRRRIRAAIVVAAVVGIVGLGSATVYGVGRLTHDAPAPAPTATATPTPTPSPTPTPEPEAILGAVTVGETLPDALPLREGMLEAAGSGWSLVQYANVEVAAELLYLVSPDGDLYEVPTPLARADAQGYSVRDWLPGSTLILMWRGSGFGQETDVVDVLTGERLLTVHGHLSGRADVDSMSIGFVGDGSTDLIVSFAENVWDPPSNVALTVRLSLDGSELASIPEFRGTDVSHTRWSLSSDGGRLALNERGRLRIVRASDFREVSTLTSPYPTRPGDCAVERWAGAGQVLLACRGGTKNEFGDWSHLEAWSAPVDGGAPTKLGSVGNWQAAWPVGDRTVIQAYAAPGTDGGTFALHLVRQDGTLGQPTAGPEIITASAGGRLYGYDPAYDVYWNHALVAVDPVAGTVVELFGAHGDYDRIEAVVTHEDR